MEALRAISLEEGRQVLPDGTILVIEYLSPANDNDFGDVEEHEAEHAVVAIKNGTIVFEASVVPEDDSLGHVSMGSPDHIAAATSKGRAGNGHDKAIVENAGQSFEANGSVAHAMVRRYKKQIRRVASALQKEKRLSGKRIEEIIQDAEEGEKIRIHIITPDGKTQTIQKRKKEGQDMLSIAELPVSMEKNPPANINAFKR